MAQANDVPPSVFGDRSLSTLTDRVQQRIAEFPWMRGSTGTRAAPADPDLFSNSATASDGAYGTLMHVHPWRVCQKLILAFNCGWRVRHQMCSYFGSTLNSSVIPTRSGFNMTENRVTAVCAFSDRAEAAKGGCSTEIGQLSR